MIIVDSRLHGNDKRRMTTTLIYTSVVSSNEFRDPSLALGDDERATVLCQWGAWPDYSVSIRTSLNRFRLVRSGKSAVGV